MKYKPIFNITPAEFHPSFVHNSKPTSMPGSDLPPTTNQEVYPLTDQKWWHIYNVLTTQPSKNHDDHLLAEGNTVQPLPLPPPPPPPLAHNSESTIPALSSLPTPSTFEEHSMTDQEWCDFRLEGSMSIVPYGELECAFFDLLERMAATIRNIYSMPPTSSESKEVALPAKVPQASNSPEFEPLAQGKRKNHWTDEEHKLFLEGLKTYGDGEWINIARDFVKTKNAYSNCEPCSKVLSLTTFK